MDEGQGEGEVLPQNVPLVPTSKLRVFSGSTTAVAALSTRPSADGLSEVPYPV
jgi:hypothetical protein